MTGRAATRERASTRRSGRSPEASLSDGIDRVSAASPTKLRLLGPFALADASRRPIAVTSARARSLLAYLAVHREAPQSRARLAVLLWPDTSDAGARNNLRQLLHGLHRAWPDLDRWLDVRSTTLALRPALETDLAEYEEVGGEATAADEAGDRPAARAAFERAAGLYRGELLAGAYDDWLEAERERLAARHGRLLDRLVGLLEEAGDYRAAIEYADGRLRLDPLDERSYRRLMRLHALDRDRPGARLVYQACVAVLERELGVEPDPATRALYERIVALEQGSEGRLPPETEPAVVAASPDAGPLVGRTAEWARLLSVWTRMTAGEAHVVVVSGEAGIGKSRLAAELVAWAARRGARSAVTRAYAAEGRLSYGPVADWLRSPAVAPALPGLEPALLSEIARLLPELLAQHPDLPRPSARMEGWQRQVLFEALAAAVRAADGPLTLVLDDLQWCDPDSLEWLHFLLRSERRAALLVVATVRTGEVDPGHPLTALLAGLRDAGQLTEIELGPLEPSETTELAAQVAGRRLAPEQARQLLAETEGNPLFVVETVRAGLDRPDRPEPDREGTTRRLPPKVQSVIAARLSQLSAPARELAALAATVGRAFSIDVVREAGTADEDALVRSLDELLGRHIVREQGGNGYDFSHDRIREVADAELTEARRRLLHRRVAEALERVHSTEPDLVAAQIAAHYASGGLIEQAVGYYLRAAEVAQRVWAHDEAIGLLRRGLTLLVSLPTPNRDELELGLQTALGVSLAANEGNGSTRVTAVFERCQALCQLLGRAPSPLLLRELALTATGEARIDDFHALANDLLSVAERDNDPVLLVQAHYLVAASLAHLGAVVPARVHFETALGHYEPGQHAAHVARFQWDPAVRCLIRLSLDLWLLGDPAGSARRRSDALDLAAELNRTYSQGYARTWDSILQLHREDHALARLQAEAALLALEEYRVISSYWPAIAAIVRGWALAGQGDLPAGIEAMQHAMAEYAATGNRFGLPFQLGLLGEQVGRSGDVERGLALLDEALALADRTNERWFEAELCRRKGDLLMATSAVRDAESAYRSALRVARHQGARALELRAATRLGALWLTEKRTDNVACLLGPIVRDLGATTDLADLDTARTLLGQAGWDGGASPEIA